MTTEHHDRQPSAATLDGRVRPAAVRPGPGRALRAGLRGRRCASISRRSTPSAMRPSRRASTTPWPRSTARAACSTGSPACSTTSPRARPRRRCRRSSARWRRCWRRTTAASTCTAALFARIDALHGRRHELGLGDEQLRVLERYHTDFVRAGARMDGAAQKRYAEVMQRLADLTTRFGQNVLADESGFQLVLRSDADFAGLPDFVRAAARQAAQRARRRRRRRDHALALAHRALPHLLRAARPARAGMARLDDARRASRRERQPRHRRRDPGAAPRAGAAARLRVVCRLRACRHHGRHAGSGDLAADAGLAAGDRPGRGRARGARGAGRSRAASRRRSSPGTGASTPRRCARSAMRSTRPRSSPTSRSSASPRRRSIAPAACSA